MQTYTIDNNLPILDKDAKVMFLCVFDLFKILLVQETLIRKKYILKSLRHKALKSKIDLLYFFSQFVTYVALAIFIFVNIYHVKYT